MRVQGLTSRWLTLNWEALQPWIYTGKIDRIIEGCGR
jgi:hypothetical protein